MTCRDAQYDRDNDASDRQIGAFSFHGVTADGASAGLTASAISTSVASTGSAAASLAASATGATTGTVAFEQPINMTKNRLRIRPPE